MKLLLLAAAAAAGTIWTKCKANQHLGGLTKGMEYTPCHSRWYWKNTCHDTSNVSARCNIVFLDKELVYKSFFKRQIELRKQEKSQGLCSKTLSCYSSSLERFLVYAIKSMKRSLSSDKREALEELKDTQRNWREAWGKTIAKQRAAQEWKAQKIFPTVEEIRGIKSSSHSLTPIFYNCSRCKRNGGEDSSKPKSGTFADKLHTCLLTVKMENLMWMVSRYQLNYFLLKTTSFYSRQWSVATSDYACLWCLVFRLLRWDMSKPLMHYNEGELKRILKNLKDFHASYVFSCIRKPLNLIVSF